MGPVTGALGVALVLLGGVLEGLRAQNENKPANAGDQPLRADPANDLFQLALHSYREAGEVKNAQRKRETYLAAARQFDRFHSRFPAHSNAIKARYYKAICHQKVGNMRGFRESLAEVVSNHKKGSLVGAAAYQLAFEHYKGKDYGEAAPLFKIAATETDNEDYRHRALYSRALCFEKLGHPKETISALKAVLADAGSPFQTQSERVLAHYYAKADMEEEALAHFIALAKSTDRTTRADAVLQCAQISRKLGKKDFARKYFEEILVTPGLEQWRGEAQLSLMSEAALAGQPQKVVDYYRRGNYQLDEEALARRLQIAAEAYESLGDTKQSTALFKELAEIAPDSMTALEAAIDPAVRRLLLQATGAKSDPRVRAQQRKSRGGSREALREAAAPPEGLLVAEVETFDVLPARARQLGEQARQPRAVGGGGEAVVELMLVREIKEVVKPTSQAPTPPPTEGDSSPSTPGSSLEEDEEEILIGTEDFDDQMENFGVSEDSIEDDWETGLEEAESQIRSIEEQYEQEMASLDEEDEEEVVSTTLQDQLEAGRDIDSFLEKKGKRRALKDEDVELSASDANIREDLFELTGEEGVLPGDKVVFDELSDPSAQVGSELVLDKTSDFSSLSSEAGHTEGIAEKMELDELEEVEEQPKKRRSIRRRNKEADSEESQD